MSSHTIELSRLVPATPDEEGRGGEASEGAVAHDGRISEKPGSADRSGDARIQRADAVITLFRGVSVTPGDTFTVSGSEGLDGDWEATRVQSSPLTTRVFVAMVRR